MDIDESIMKRTKQMVEILSPKKRKLATRKYHKSGKYRKYEVESILDHRKGDKGGVSYLVKWKGFSNDKASWVRSCHMSGCEKLLQTYHDKLKPDTSSIKRRGRPCKFQNRSLTILEIQARWKSIEKKASQIFNDEMIKLPFLNITIPKENGIMFIWWHIGPTFLVGDSAEIRSYYVRTQSRTQDVWVQATWLESNYTHIVQAYWSGKALFLPSVWVPDAKSKYAFNFSIDSISGVWTQKLYTTKNVIFQADDEEMKESRARMLREALARSFGKHFDSSSHETKQDVAGIVLK